MAPAAPSPARPARPIGSARVSPNAPYRVAIVDDSAVVRGMIARWVDEERDIEIVGRFANGRQAVERLGETDAEIAILDIEMPEMDGITALPKLLKAYPGLTVLMASTLTLRNADISMQALRLGAADYVPKPETSGLSGATEFRAELLNKIRVLAEASRARLGPGAGVMPPSGAGSQVAAGANPTTRARFQSRSDGGKPAQDGRSFAGASRSSPPQSASTGRPGLRAPSQFPAECLGIGSSTGGPQALMDLFTGLRGKIRVPVFVAQHMPPTFTTILAEHLTKVAGIPAKEAENGETVEPAKIYVAPGDFHMVVEGKGPHKTIRLTQDPPENFCRPAVDPLFRSLARQYGSKLLGVVLTGMGHDGRNGAEAIVTAGGTVLAQDEATSVVWGMPAAIAQAGLASAILPLNDLPRKVTTLIKDGRS